MQRLMVIFGTALLVGCGQSNGDAAANETANAAQPKKKPAYCFFKGTETKGWAASRDKDGNIVVKGKAFRSDPRYKALLNPAVVAAKTAEISPTIAINDTGFGAPDNWWDVSATIPESAAVDTVIVRCGAKSLAELNVPPKG